MFFCVSFLQQMQKVGNVISHYFFPSITGYLFISVRVEMIKGLGHFSQITMIQKRAKCQMVQRQTDCPRLNQQIGYLSKSLCRTQNFIYRAIIIRVITHTQCHVQGGIQSLKHLRALFFFLAYPLNISLLISLLACTTQLRVNGVKINSD